MKMLPETQLGKWSVGLTMFFVLLIAVFLVLMLFGIVTFDVGHWWDVTVGIAFPAEIIAFLLAVMAVKKKKDQTVLVYVSIFIGICVILFILLHSLFIND